MNYMMPEEGVMPMHASANTDVDGNTAIFFGLSGTGKTTLSADASRTLIGDDEHGWSESSVFNFEGGCYAKVIKLSEKDEPEIYATTKQFGTVLENVIMDDNGQLDLDDNTLTENTRASYPIESIPNASTTGMGKQPTTIIMLTADAFGVLPPISKLTADQAMYHFLSGYTAKVAGTEKGLGKEPVACFSACFGLPFMPRNPKVYAEMLKEKINNSEVNCWLVNTGWTGGAYGTGERMSIKYTRAMINAALSGELAKIETTTDEFFGLHIPTNCPGVPSDVLNPQSTWSDKKAYAETAHKVLNMFADNFIQFEDMDGAILRAA
jgi:phosphoenolpyruvate carboxykinase (ATP)